MMKSIVNNNTALIILFYFGLLGLICIFIVDKFYFKMPFLIEVLPHFSTGFLIRSTCIFLSILAMLFSITILCKETLVLDKSIGVPINRLSIGISLFLSIVFLCLFMYMPKVFHAISIEDSIIELSSAVLLFMGSIIFFIIFLKVRKIIDVTILTKLSFILLSFILIIIAMEEISWFQNVFSMETAEIFMTNSQYEMNIHNFNTDLAENLYYFGTFIFLVLFPFLRFLFPYISNNEYLKVFIARPFIAVVASIAYAYNFDMWNTLPTQVAFYTSMIILFIFIIFSTKRVDNYIIGFTIILMLITQVLFLNNGINFTRPWEVTEYKELFIPFALFIYALDVYMDINGKINTLKSCHLPPLSINKQMTVLKSI